MDTIRYIDMSYIDVSKLEMVQEITQSLAQYKAEFLNLPDFKNTTIYVKKFQSVTPQGLQVYSGKVNTYMLKLDETLLDAREKVLFSHDREANFERQHQRRELCPLHKNFLTNNPSVRQMFYNILHPGAKINPHYGVNGLAVNKVPDHFRIHITVEPGDDSYFYIDNLNPLKYRENLCFGFKDGLVNHWAENRGTQIRNVLILDVDKSILPKNLTMLEV